MMKGFQKQPSKRSSSTSSQPPSSQSAETGSGASKQGNGTPTLSSSLKRWTGKAGTILMSPVTERFLQATTKVMGICDLAESAEREEKEIVDCLACINKQVLNRLSPESNLDEATLDVLESLISVIGEVHEFLTRRKSHNRMSRIPRAEEISRLQKKLDSISARFVLIYSIGVGVRVDRIEQELTDSETLASLADQVPHAELPPPPSVLCGRDDLVRTLTQLLCTSEGCHIPLLGPGGIGKTSVATTVANDLCVKKKFQDAIVFVSCEGVVSAEGIMHGIAASLGLQRDSDVLRNILIALSCKPHLMVLDNLETAWDSVDKVNVERLLGKLTEIPRFSLMITMRGAVQPGGVRWVEADIEPLQPLSLEAARQMWNEIARYQDANLDRLLEMLDGLPLAISLMAHQGQLLTPTELLDAYRSEKTAIMETEVGNRLTSLEVSIRLSIESHTMSCARGAKELLPLLCLMPNGVLTSKLHQTFPSLRDGWKGALALCAVGLAFVENGRLRALTPLRDFVQEHFVADESLLTDLRKHCMNLTCAAEKVDVATSGHSVQELSIEFGNIHSVLRHFWKARPDTDLLQLLHRSTQRLATFSYATRFGDCSQLLDDARLLLEERGDEYAAAECQRKLGSTFAAQHRFEEALDAHQVARAAFERLADHWGLAHSTLSVARALRSLNRYEPALSTYEEAESKFRCVRHRRGRAQSLQGIAHVLRVRTKYKEALQKLREAQTIFEAINDPSGIAQCIRSSANILGAMGRYEAAIEKLEQAKATFLIMADRGRVAEVTRSIGNVMRMVGRYGEALQKHEEAKATFDEMKDPLGGAKCNQGIGNVLRMLGRYEEAMKHLEQAKATFEPIGYRLDAVQCSHSIGNILRMLRREAEAIDMLEDARRSFEELGDRLGIAQCTQNLGDIIAKIGRHDDALERLEAARTTFEAIEDRLGMAQCNLGIGNVLRKLKRFDEAYVSIERARRSFQAIGDPVGAADCDRTLGYMAMTQKHYEQSMIRLERALSAYEKIGLQYAVRWCTEALLRLQRRMALAVPHQLPI